MAQEIEVQKYPFLKGYSVKKIVNIAEDIFCPKNKYVLIYTENALRGGVIVFDENDDDSHCHIFFEIFDLEERGYPDRTVSYKKFLALAMKLNLSEKNLCSLLLVHVPKLN